MFCDQCGNEVKDTERFCSRCGAPVQSQPVQQSVEPAVTLQNNVYGMTFDSQPQQQSKAKKGISKGVVISAVAGVAVIAVLVVLFANFAWINNFVHKTFSSPEDYYRFVEKNAVKDAASITGDIYANSVLEGLDLYNQRADGKVSLTLGKAGQEYVELLGLAGVDLSWLRSVDIDAGYYMGEDLIGMNIGTAINGDGIVSSEILLDVEEETIYIQIPELSKTYIGIDCEEYFDKDMRKQFDEIAEQREARKKLKESCPSQAEVEKMFSKYMDIMLEHVDDVKKGEKTIKAEGIQQDCTELKVMLDDDTLRDMFVSVMEEMMDDKELKQIIIAVTDASASNEDGEDMYDDFVDALEDAIDSLEKSSSASDMEIEMTVYVDGKGEIRGRKFNITQKSYEQEFSMLMPEKGKKFGYELSYESSKNRYDFTLTGSGQRSGDKISGDFKFKSNGTSLIDITATNLDTKSLKRGDLNGKISVKPSSTIGRLMGMAGTGFSFGDMQIDIEAKTEKKSTEYNITVLYDDEELGRLFMSGKRQPASQVKVPKDVVFVEDAGDLADFLEDVDWDSVIDRLEKTDLPSEAIDELEDFVELVENGSLERLLNGSRRSRYLY